MYRIRHWRTHWSSTLEHMGVQVAVGNAEYGAAMPHVARTYGTYMPHWSNVFSAWPYEKICVRAGALS